MKNKNKDVESNFLLNWADNKLDITKNKTKKKIIKKLLDN